MKLAAIFLFLNSIVLTFSQSIRLHGWAGSVHWEQWIGFIVWLAGFAFFFRRVNQLLPDRDPYILPIISLLSGWGLLEIFRISPIQGFRQTAWLLVSLVVLTIGIRLPKLLNWLRRYKYVWLSSGLLLMLLTLLVGTYPGGNGPGLWLQMFGVYLQPSEFLKLLLVIYLAAYLADNIPAHFKLVQLVAPTLVVALAALGILIAQKDLGTASLIIMIYTLIIYVASGKRRILLISFLSVALALVGGYLVFDVIRLRIEAWINPWLDPSGRSYQIVQSILAVANGGLFGRGLGLGSPGVVPVAHSDFIFSSISEEFGLAGAIGLCLLLAILAIRGIAIALHAPNQFQRFLAIGLTSSLIVQSGLIISGTIRALPLTGVTLPFVSYGGSSLLTSFFSALLLLLISNQAEDQPAALERLTPYTLIGTVFLSGFLIVSLFTGWWSMVRAGALLNRSDNPRRAISDMYVLRGKIVDRNNEILAQSSGTAGSYVRVLKYPSLSATVGYSNPDYGQTGIEKSMDGYLRGIEGNSALAIWESRELYGQYPPGLDVRLSLDASLQQTADGLLKGYKGALILMNARTGEILASATAPTFDANQLASQWQTWMNDQDAPLLNRVTQGQYPVGDALAPFLYAATLSEGSLPPVPDIYTYTPDEASTLCTIKPANPASWADLVESGCSYISTELASSIGPTQLWSLFTNLGLFTQPNIPIETAKANTLAYPIDFQSLESNTDSWRISPLQMVLAVSALTNGGILPEPQLAAAYKNPSNDWIALQYHVQANPLSDFAASIATQRMATGSFPAWESISKVEENGVWVNWYLAGSAPSWKATPLALVVVTEGSTPEQTRSIGRNMLMDAINP